MFYFFSRIFNFFLAPEHWLYILLGVAFFTKRNWLRKRLLVTAFIIFIFFSNEALFNTVANAWQPAPSVLPDSAHYSAGVLLGGLSMMDKNNNGYLSEEADRFTEMLLLYHRGVVDKIIISGTNPKDKKTEAEYLREMFIAGGVPGYDVLAETHAKNTAENAAFSKRLLDSLHAAPPYVVVTSAFHIRRAAMAFKKENMEVIMYPSAYMAIQKELTIDEYLVPNVNILHKWRFIIKEVFGIWVYRMAGKG